MVDLAGIDVEQLVAVARRARENAYAPYSKYRIGAALLAVSGAVHVGCNVENASYGATLCAERVAVACAVAAGERSFRALAVFVGGNRPAMPCGLCRQVLAEFGLDTLVIAACADGERQVVTLAELLPHPFSL
ncbi:MAG: cytidine deaminase [Dehalococcoidales bacterium]|nr:cytidine deaminase [Dehalococcoidales bacterium]